MSQTTLEPRFKISLSKVSLFLSRLSFELSNIQVTFLSQFVLEKSDYTKF